MILIAVALFAALSFAVTKSGSFGKNSNQEQYLLTLSRLQGTIASIQSGITRVRALGCSETQVSFEKASVEAPPYVFDLWDTASFVTYVNPDAPADKSCHVFEPEGGNVTVPETYLMGQNFVSVYNAIYQYRTNYNFSGVGTGAPDLFVLVGPFTDEFCEFINKRAGISGVPQLNFGDATMFTGDYGIATNLWWGADEAKDFFCFNNYSPSQNWMVRVVVPR